MCDPCASVLSCARENLLPLARKHLFPLALDHLLPILKEAVNMIRGLPNDEIAHMKLELETIEEAIHRADKMADAEVANPADGTREKIKQLIEASFRIQDVVDEYIIRKEQQLPDPGCAAAASDYVKTKMLRLQIAYDIQNIKSRINEINDHETSSSSTTNLNAKLLQNLRKTPFYMNEDDVVGFEEPKKILIDWLVEGKEELTAVSLVAMGGQGKTTLAKKVFDSKEVMGYFDYRVWITVSQSYNIEELLTNMLKELRVNLPREMTLESLVREVRNYLQEKRYVVVFDDVWDSGFWDDIRFAMIDKKKGSRILITTRNINVANACREFYFVKIHQLIGLNDKQSLDLFNKKAFYDLEGFCPENLVHISSKIVEQCDGLPLAIIVTGGILSRKVRAPFEWNRFNENLNLELNKNSMINIILGLSYHDLPYNLKSCCLYFGLYPEDYKVPSKILTRQWMAEGFVKEARGWTVEEVAEGYLTELICTNLVQVVSISIDGRAKSCRVHDLVHAMILEKCEDLSFCKNIFEDKQSSLPRMVRRLSITTTNSDNVMKSIENSQVRTLLVTSKTLPESFERRIPTKYRSLKVLHFEDNVKDLEVGSLSQLKYFKFPEGGHFGCLPRSIGMLENLETLDLRYSTGDSHIMKLPMEICKLRKLRHLLGCRMSLISMKEGIGGMTSLQTLSEVHLNEREDENDNRVVELIQELGKLKKLRELALIGVMSKYRSAISSSVNEMQQLEKLRIGDARIYGPHQAIDLNLNSPPPKLQILKLTGKLEKLPRWISKLQNLAVLMLHDSVYRYDHILELLKGLPNLLSLSLDYGDLYSELTQLHFQAGSFKNLKELAILDLRSLKRIYIDEGAMPDLKKFSISVMMDLGNYLPYGIEHLKKLEVIKYYSPTGSEITAKTYQKIMNGEIKSEYEDMDLYE